MSDLRVRPYTPRDLDAWDDIVARSWNGTFLHTRRYMSYYRDRFEDASLVVEGRNSRLVGVFPAATHVSDPAMVESHPGIGYGGLVHDGALHGSKMRDALEAVAERYYHDGKRSLRYEAVPYVYHRVPAADDLYGLFLLGAVRSRCDLSSVIDVANRPRPRKGRISSLRKAERAGVRVERGPEHLTQFWSVLTGRLGDKHQAEPRHTLAEVRHLQSLFPDEIDCIVGTLGGHVVAGLLLFRTGHVSHTQYIGADDRGYRTSALDLVVQRCIEECQANSIRYFSFGNSTFYGGRVFSTSLHQFKSGFGAGGVVYEAYDLLLV